MEKFLAEEKGIKLGIAPQSVTGTLVNGDRVGLKDQKRVAIVVQLGASTAAVTTFSLQQHDAALGGTSKALSISNAYFHKLGAETSFSKVEVDPAASSYDLSGLAGIANGGVLVFEVLQEDLDVNGGFSHISAHILGDATARVCSAVYVGASEFLPAYELAL